MRRVRFLTLLTLLCLILPSLAASQNATSLPPDAEAQKGAALTHLNLGNAPDQPALTALLS